MFVPSCKVQCAENVRLLGCLIAKDDNMTNEENLKIINCVVPGIQTTVFAHVLSF